MIDFNALAIRLSSILSWEVIASCYGSGAWGMFVDVTPGFTEIMTVVNAQSP